MSRGDDPEKTLERTQEFAGKGVVPTISIYWDPGH